MGQHIWNMYFMLFNCIITMVYSETYIVHMNSSAMPKPYTSPHSWYQATLQSISDQTVAHISTEKLIYGYTHAIQGFSASLTSFEHDNLKKTPGYLFSTKDTRVQLLATHSTEFLGLNSDFGAWPISRYGKDVIIGIVDTGVWPESKSYNDEGMDEIPSRWRGECQAGTQFNSSMCNKKLIGARYFNKGYIRSYPKANITMNSTRDTIGHGTHTSSIAAGNFVKGASYFGYGMGTLKGVAPHARLAIYKPFWIGEVDSVSSDVLAAIDQAIIDGVDILSMSVSSDTNSYMKSHTTPWYKDPIAIASFTATKKGIFVSMAGGNGGSGFPTIINDMPWVLTVAAGTMDRKFSCLITLGNGAFVPGISLYHDSFTSSQIPMFFMGQCNNISHGDQNRICVSSSEKEPLTVQNSKAAAIVFITDQDTLVSTEYQFPVVYVSLQNGRILGDYIREEGEQATGKISFHLTRLGIVPAPMVGEFSSRGPARGLPVILKPDLMAPGHQILASWPYLAREDGSMSEFNIDSGTSMACPHASGLAAILKAVHPDWSPAAIRSAMMTTSSITDNSNNPIKEITWDVIKEANPLAMGAGHISPNKALNPGLIYDMDVGDYVDLLCGLNFTLTQIEVITRSSTYNCNNPTLDVNYPSFIGSFSKNEIPHTRGKVLKVFQRTITSVENEISVYKATLTGLKGFNVTVEPSTLIFTKKNDKKSYKLVIEGPILKDNVVVHGFLSWVSTKRKNVVRSPIVALGRMSRPGH